MAGKTDKPRKWTKDGSDSYRNNKFWDEKKDKPEEKSS